MPRVTLKSATYLGERTDPPVEKGGKPWTHDAFNVVLECGGRTFETPWNSGIGNRVPRKTFPRQEPKSRLGAPGVFYSVSGGWEPGKPIPPKAEDVLSSLLMDASGTDETFDDWASSYGYDTDSRRALALYLTCQETARKLRTFLGRSVLDVQQEWGDFEDAAKALCAE